MKMPEQGIPSAMLAPCGMNCMVCYKHCAHKKACAGCLQGDAGKPEHCRKCPIKNCVQEKGLSYCFQCDQMPCRRLKSLDKSYRTRYGTSLVENSVFVRQHGLNAFLRRQAEAFTCVFCGGVFSLHDGKCSECGAALKS